MDGENKLLLTRIMKKKINRKDDPQFPLYFFVLLFYLEQNVRNPSVIVRSFGPEGLILIREPWRRISAACLKIWPLYDSLRFIGHILI